MVCRLYIFTPWSLGILSGSSAFKLATQQPLLQPYKAQNCYNSIHSALTALTGTYFTSRYEVCESPYCHDWQPLVTDALKIAFGHRQVFVPGLSAIQWCMGQRLKRLATGTTLCSHVTWLHKAVYSPYTYAAPRFCYKFSHSVNFLMKVWCYQWMKNNYTFKLM
jgi:hypothetical protein